MEQGKTPPPHISPKGMWASKLALRVVQFVLAITTIGCVGSFLASGISSIVTLIVIIPQAAVSTIWSFAEGICIITRAGRRGIHPGANVALDLVLWLGLIVGTVLLWLLGVATPVTFGYYNYADSYNQDRYDTLTEMARLARLGQALLGLGSTLTILHFTTFVIACVETSNRNRAERVVFVTQYAQGPQYGYNGQAMGYAPAPPAPVYEHPAGKDKGQVDDETN
jgi:hypothetical protein